MAFQNKVAIAEQLAETLKGSKGTVVVDYRGLNVADVSSLRRRLREENVEFRVAKNTLLRRAASASDFDDVDELFVGPTAIATSAEDEVMAAKLLNDAIRTTRVPITIKGGIYSSRGVSADQVKLIAGLPGREVMLALAVGTAQAPRLPLSVLFTLAFVKHLMRCQPCSAKEKPRPRDVIARQPAPQISRSKSHQNRTRSTTKGITCQQRKCRRKSSLISSRL